MDNNLIVSFESFEEIEQRQNKMIKQNDKARDEFRTKDYLDSELTWNRSDNSYYNTEGQKLI